MIIIDRLKKRFHRLAEAPSGQRFMREYEDHRKDREADVFRSRLYLGLGVVMVVGGVLISIPPGLPGFLISIPGLAIVAAHSRSMARLMDWSETLICRLLTKLPIERLKNMCRK